MLQREETDSFRLEQCCELLRRERPAEMVSLRLIASMILEEGKILGGFNSFGNDSEMETLSHADNRTHNCSVTGRTGDLADEGLIDLEGIQRKFSQVAQAGITCAEVIDGNAHLSLP